MRMAVNIPPRTPSVPGSRVLRCHQYRLRFRPSIPTVYTTARRTFSGTAFSKPGFGHSYATNPSPESVADLHHFNEQLFSIGIFVHRQILTVQFFLNG